MPLAPAVRLAAVALATLCVTTQAATIYVSTAGNDTKNGQSWPSAKRTIQGALSAAPPGDQVWVRAGTYLESIWLADGIQLYGGFAGTETDLAQRNWITSPTILDGNRLGGVVTAPYGAGPATRIDGFTIRNGSAYTGGGIYCSGSSPTIANNTITANAASADGGGIYCDSSSPVIIANTITGNSAGTSYDGGGICCLGNSSPKITSNTISGNSAGYGGGIYCNSASPVIAGNTIASNTATNFGAGIDFHYSSGTTVSNIFAGNGAADAGGGIYCYHASPVIANNMMKNNSTGSDGGAICCDYSSPAIVNNTIAGNRASSGGGGGIFSYNASPTVTNSIIAFNSSGIGKSGTGTPTLRYNCVYGNRTSNYSGLTNPTGANGNLSADPQFMSATPGPDTIWGTADDIYTDLHPLPGSPCIDAGSNADVPADAADLDADGNTTEPLPFDLAGASRFLDDPTSPDTGAGTAPLVDIGAYEHLCGDVTGDGHVDVVDLLWLIDAFGTVPGDPTYDPRCDFNHDNAVDVVDLLYMIDTFGM